ncbi:LTA synthase family protein [Roseomonas sp. NAR14]|uniref:LTA synthase family protein n=1 Tax=Roseomonas acroporae TaxID=2937791 RepID=A0A9X1YDM1_9PROT|nr:LTA synthase family protein [Roseomonas acroporae]MCK8784591.1 LTA synthase family protein [Roseomonas acroporae]
MLTFRLLLGAALPLLPLAGWRLALGARRLLPGLPAELAGPAAAWLLLLAATDRPLFAGLGAAAPVVALMVVDAAKRRVLREPLLFSDALMLPLVARHPHLYLPFAGGRLIPGALLLGGLAALALLLAEPAAGLGAARRGLALIGAALGWRLVLRPPAALVRRLMPDGGAVADPAADQRRLGPLATLVAWTACAAAERPGRRDRVPPGPPPTRAGRPAAPAVARPDPARDGAAPHLVLIQSESFLDAARLGHGDLLPHWASLGASSLQRGPLAVAGFGANTMRAEFAVLTGIPDAALGLDRFNPYFRFARRPVRSLAWTLRARGHSATFLHPHDPRFFARDRVMPALGFERFESEADFPGADRVGRYVADAALGERLAALLRAPAPQFLFAVTMQAHGPWPGADPRGTYLRHLADADAMLGIVAAAARRAARPVVLCLYGDHLPALPGLPETLGRDTDYLIWRSDRRGGGARRPLAAAALHDALLAALRQPADAVPAA